MTCNNYERFSNDQNPSVSGHQEALQVLYILLGQ